MAVTKAQKMRRKMFWSKNRVPLLGITLFAVVGAVLLATIYAAPGGKPGKPVKGTTVTPTTTAAGTAAIPRTSNLKFSLYATHPYASKAGFTSASVNYYTGAKLCTTAAFCPVGQTLTDLGVSASGELVAGYGDWNENVDSFGVPEGRVGVVPLNLATKTWGPITAAGSEAIDVIREINGKIYAPTTDPSDTLGSKSGYVTNANGAWQLVWDKTGAIHTLDVASSNGSDIFVVGSVEGGGAKAAAWRSTDGGATFTLSTTNAGTTATSWERYYFAGVANGQLRVSAAGVNPLAHAKSFDGASWNNNNQVICYSRLAQDVVTYEGKILCNWTGTTTSGGVSVTSPCTTSGVLCAFDGTNASQVQFTTATGNTVSDMYVRDGYLYILSPTGYVYRGNSLTGVWKCLGQFDVANGTAASIAVYNDSIYIGSSSGKIFKSDIPVSQIQ